MIGILVGITVSFAVGEFALMFLEQCHSDW